MKAIAEVLGNVVDSNSWGAQYADPRWKSRAEEIRRNGAFCHSCRRAGVLLHVHHVVYIKGKPLWEHEDRHLVVLCDNCHETIHKAIQSFRVTAGFCNATSILAIVGALQTLIERKGETQTVLALQTLLRDHH